MQSLPERPEKLAMYSNGHVKRPQGAGVSSRSHTSKHQGGIVQLLVCVGGIYATFLTWGLLQERIPTTPFQPERSWLHPASGPEYFKFPIFLNTIQSLFAFISGSLYLLSTSSGPLLPSRASLAPLLIIATTQTLASPFGYASLSHVDYLTFVLAKSCKLLPVMLLHILSYQ